jgi:hypothetical protein
MRITELRDKANVRFLVNAYDDSSIQQIAMQHLEQEGFQFAGILPRYKRLSYNLDCDLPWQTGFPPQQIERIEKILHNLVK